MCRSCWLRIASVALGVALIACARRPAFSPELANGPTTIDAIDRELHRLEGEGFTGVVLLAKGEQVLLERGYGLADREARRPMLPTTGFDIGSITKVFTASAILALERDGKLRRSDNLGRFFPTAPPDKRAITLGQLLAHTSGLADIVDRNGQPVGYTPDFDYEPVTRDEIVRRAMSSALDSAPGERERYSNLGYSLLGVIVELVSGEPYDAYLRRAILEPAGMTRAGYRAPGWQPGELAVGYTGGKRWGTPLDHPWLADGPSWNLRSNGGLLACARDLLAWTRALDRGSVLDGDARRALFDLTVHTTSRGSRVMGPAGSNEIFDAIYVWFVDESRTVIVLTSDPRVRAEDLAVPLIKAMRAAGQ